MTTLNTEKIHSSSDYNLTEPKLVLYMKVSLFLGSGASVPCGMPTTKQFKEQFLKTGDSNEYIKTLLKTSDFQDIEYVLRAIEEIKNVKKYGKLILDFIQKNEFNNAVQVLTHIDALEKDIHAHVYKFYNSDKIKNLNIYDWIFQLLYRYDGVIDIFTTNYDQIIEKYMQNKKESMLLHDGFKLDPTDNLTKFAPNNFVEYGTKQKAINLYKLHGSLNWRKESDHITRSSIDSQSSNEENNLIIYPTLDPKEGLDSEPFTSINQKFKERIKETDVLIVIGYSFRDAHINEVFQELLDLGKSIVVISPTVHKDLESCKYFGNVSSNNKISLSNYFIGGKLANITSDEWLKIRKKLHNSTSSFFSINEDWTHPDTQSILTTLFQE